MFFALISTFLESSAVMFWKKALTFNAPKELFSLLAHSSIFFISIVLYITGNFDVQPLNINLILLILMVFCIGFIRILLVQYVYAKDKISTILPYQNISKIITIVAWFFIFEDTSLTTLMIAILTVIIIVIFSIDFKSFRIPKTIKTYSLSELLYAFNLLTIGYLLTQITNVSYFIYSYIVSILIIGSIVILKWQIKTALKLPKKFYLYRITACHFGWSSYILSLLVIQSLWVTMSVLISYIWLWITLLFSYLFFWDKPERKNIILTIIVSILIWLWYYYK